MRNSRYLLNFILYNYNIPTSYQIVNVLSKIILFNSTGGPNPPTAEPFGSVICQETLARGFRNPFRTAFKPGTSRLFINDVGGGYAEEVNELVIGGNYGWPTW